MGLVGSRVRMLSWATSKAAAVSSTRPFPRVLFTPVSHDRPVVRSNRALVCEIIGTVDTGATAEVSCAKSWVLSMRSTTTPMRPEAGLKRWPNSVWTPVLRSFTRRSTSNRSRRPPPTTVTRGAIDKASSPKTEATVSVVSKSTKLPAPGKLSGVSAGKVPRSGANGSTEVVVPNRRGMKNVFRLTSTPAERRLRRPPKRRSEASVRRSP